MIHIIPFIIIINILSQYIPTVTPFEYKKCSVLSPRLETIQLFIDYAHLRKIHQIVFFNNFQQPGCHREYILQFIQCGVHGQIFISSHSFNVQHEFLEKLMKIQRNRLGLFIYLTDYGENTVSEFQAFLEKAATLLLFTEYYVWFVIIDNSNTTSYISDLIINSRIGLNTDFVIAIQNLNNNRTLSNQTQIEKNKQLRQIDSYIKKRKNLCVNLLRAYESVDRKQSRNEKERGNINFILNDVDIKKKKRDLGKNKTNEHTNMELLTSIYYLKEEMNITRDIQFINNTNKTTILNATYILLQIYKTRRDENMSMILQPIESWNLFDDLKSLNKLNTNISKRTVLPNSKFIIGITNRTDINGINGGDSNEIMTINDQHEHILLDTATYFGHSINANVIIQYYSSLGTETYDGSWTHLLGAVISETVDLGIDYVSVSGRKRGNMYFTQPLMHSKRNIYYHPPNKNEMRDIYLIPFQFNLKIAVICMILITAIIIFIINSCTRYIRQRCEMERAKIIKISLLEATFSSFGIICMQGSFWNPRTKSGKIVIIASLLFTIIIYNSYAAYITSILSTNANAIRNVQDIFNNEYQIGFLRKGQDESYLMNSNDTLLKRIFMKGYFTSHIDNPTIGLMKVAKRKFALFLSEHEARRTLVSTIPYDCRCLIHELTIEQTTSPISFPMSINSPYKEIVNLGIIRMREFGLLNRIQKYMLPAMPNCEEHINFNSAQLEDVYTAFAVLAFFMVLSIIFLLSECFWKYRKILSHQMYYCCVQINHYNERRISDKVKNFTKSFHPDKEYVNEKLAM